MSYKTIVQNFQNKQNINFVFFFLKIFTRKATPALNFNKQLEVKYHSWIMLQANFL